MADDLLFFNGVNGSTGNYEVPPLSPADFARAVLGELDPTESDKILNEDDTAALKEKDRSLKEGHFGPKEGVDPLNLAQTGWGVIFAFQDQDKADAIREALSPLLEHRKKQAGPLYREYVGKDAYRPNESKQAFLKRFGMGAGPADPDKVPYYLLIVGDPEAIPYRFQYQIDVQYGAGRIHFDTLEEYDRYARSVVAAETGQFTLSRQATFFGVANPSDRATQLSSKEMVAPLAELLKKNQSAWAVETVMGEAATKSRLGEVMGGAKTPSLLFTASHGMGFKLGDPNQLPHQGALLCQDWPGPDNWRKPIPRDFYFSAEDLGSDANLIGRIAFFFACYGGGTPKLDDFSKQAKRPEIAPHAFLARLPMRMLSLEKGGALAVVGHVERAWGTSFYLDKAGRQLAVFQSALERLMKGDPIGWGMEYFNERYAELSSDLTDFLQETYPYDKDDLQLASNWTANNDARSYVVLGDPAARLPLGDAKAKASKPYELAAGKPRPKAVAGGDPTPPAASVQAAAMTETTGEIDYGLFPDLKQAQSDLQKTMERIGQTLAKAVENLTTLEVHTYLADEAGAEGAPRHECKSIIKLDGDEQHHVPRRDDEIDAALWAIHAGMLEQARHNRTEVIKTVLTLFKP